jgi:hydrogenase maturation protein HypF
VQAGRRIAVRGTVQGVGFRPWVYRVALESGVAGRVRNDSAGVTIEVFGPAPALDVFVARLRAGSPPPSRIRELAEADIPGEDAAGFTIDRSAAGGAVSLSIPPDLATCPACLAELRDPADRRHAYAFINCTACGPRFTIAVDVPYDRPLTSMAGFRMCTDCQREYDDPGDRRFHAQPNACPACGPRLRLEPPQEGDPVAVAAARLREGAIVAVRGLGGFHLACDAASEAAVARLRERKRRDEKPFAVMVRGLDDARALAVLSPEEEGLLLGPERPIVLVPRRDGAPLAANVAPDTTLVGLFLAYTPLHDLLLAAAGGPLVMTSANRSDEPIARTDEHVRLLGAIADLSLTHDREIVTRCDDSVARVIAGGPTLLRRSRGWVPRPIVLRQPVPRPILACGAQLKNTFCLAQGDVAYLGPHVGDLDNLESLAFFREAVERMERLVHVRPEVIAHDLHPDYLSTRYALERPEAHKVGVQHHHAHVASAMAEHGLAGPVYGVAYDGTGHAGNGATWGGELLLVTFAGFERLATFRPVRLAGGDQAVRQPWRVALALLVDAFDGAPPLDLPLFAQVPGRDLSLVRQMLDLDLNAPPAHGVGRLFDGVGALVLARPRAAYEGQVAIALNLVAAPGRASTYPVVIQASSEPWIIDPRPMVRAIAGDVRAGVPPAAIAARFHHTLVVATAEVLRLAIARRGEHPILLTGGCFANPLLAEGLLGELQGLDVRLQREVPPGDGGIALGQAAVAARRS